MGTGTHEWDGYEPMSRMVYKQCPICGGRGFVWRTCYGYESTAESDIYSCEVCEGNGAIGVKRSPNSLRITEVVNTTRQA